MSRTERSQAAHDVHALIHAASDEAATVCLFRHADKIILSFACNGSGCLLSDWYAPNDENFLELLDASNFSSDDVGEYFCDMVNLLARKYYFHNSNPTAYSLLPIDHNSSEEIPLKNFDDMINEQRFSDVKKYGDDYVECDAGQLVVADEKRDILYLSLLEHNGVELAVKDDKDNEPTEDDLANIDLADIDSEIFDDAASILEYPEKNHFDRQAVPYRNSPVKRRGFFRAACYNVGKTFRR